MNSTKHHARAPLAGAKIIPAPGTYLVRRIKAGYARSSGIVLAKADKTDSYVAEIIATSPLPYFEYGIQIPVMAEVGAYVILTTFACGQKLSEEDGGADLCFVRHIEIVGIVEKSEYDAAMLRATGQPEAGAENVGI